MDNTKIFSIIKKKTNIKNDENINVYIINDKLRCEQVAKRITQYYV